MYIRVYLGLWFQIFRVHDDCSKVWKQEQKVKGSHPEPQAQGRRNKLEMVQVFIYSEPTSSDIPPLIRPYLLGIPKHHHQLETYA